MQTSSMADVLARLPLFVHLPPDHIELVTAGTRQRRLARDEVLFHAGQACTAPGRTSSRTTPASTARSS